MRKGRGRNTHRERELQIDRQTDRRDRQTGQTDGTGKLASKQTDFAKKRKKEVQRQRDR